MSEVKQVIVFRHDLLKNLRKGKIAAQVAHASLGALLKCANRTEHTNGFLNTDKWIRIEFDFNKDSVLDKWLNGIFTKICVYVENEEELLEIYNKAQAAGLPCSLITDAGNTEFHGVPTNTCVGIGPSWSEDIDEITGNLKLF